MTAWLLITLLVVVLALAVRVALYYRERALYFRACKDAQVAESMRLAQMVREAQAEGARLAQMVRDSEAAYAGLLESVKVGSLVRLPSDEQLEKGTW